MSRHPFHEDPHAPRTLRDQLALAGSVTLAVLLFGAGPIVAVWGQALLAWALGVSR